MQKVLKVFLMCFIITQPVFATSNNTPTTSDKLNTLYEIIKSAGWGEDTDNTERMELFKQVENLIKQDHETIDELEKNATAMKDKEQSTANKLLGGATMAATGIGAMQAASAYSEQQADKDAETSMKAYLATFHCNYGGGMNIPGGEKEVQLPGGNELIDLYAEYVNLANNLKVRKAALEMRPGIESEAILDSATSGLYDDIAIGKTSGAFTSLARALQDPEGEDAKAWATQKDASAQKLKTGLTVAGIGAVGGAVGNLLINKNSAKENSDNILAKREKLTQTLDETIKKIIENCNIETQKAKDVANQIKTTVPDWQSNEEFNEFVTLAETAEFLNSENDITKIRKHPVCN